MSDTQVKVGKCIVCAGARKYGSYYCSRDCWATCPPALFEAARIVAEKQNMQTLREAVVYLLTMKVNSRSLGEVLKVSHGTVCRWRLEVTRRLSISPNLGVLDANIGDITDMMIMEIKPEAEAPPEEKG